MSTETKIALSVTDTAKALKIGAGSSKLVEEKLFKVFGLIPLAYVRGESGGHKITRPIYLEADVMDAVKSKKQMDMIKQDEVAHLREQNRLLNEKVDNLIKKLGGTE